MAALNFPSSPTLNDVYSANGKTYVWNGTSWIARGTKGFPFTGSAGITGSLLLTGNQTISGSLLLIGNQIISGSLITTADAAVHTGSMRVSGSLAVIGTISSTLGFLGTSSWAISASRAVSSSASVSSSFATTASYALSAVAILPEGVVSSSAQFRTITNPFTGSFTGAFAGSYNGTVTIPSPRTLTLGSQIFYPQSTNGFSVNEDYDPSNNASQVAYHFTSGTSTKPSVVFTLAVTNRFTNMFGVTGSASDNKFVIGAEYSSTDFEFRNNLGIRPIQLQGGTLLARITRNGQMSANSFTSSLSNQVGFVGTSSFAVSASWAPSVGGGSGLFASSSVSASWASSSISSSYAATASLLLGSIQSASYALTAVSASYAPGSPSISASYALTASYALNGGSGGGIGGSGVGAMQEIATIVTSQSQNTVTFSNIDSTYKSLMITANGRSSAVAGDVTIRGIINGDSGSNYEWGRENRFGTTVTLTATYMELFSVPGASIPANQFSTVTAFIHDYADSYRMKQVHALSDVRISGTIAAQTATGFWKNTGSLSSIAFYPSSGNWETGSTFTLYGIGGPSASLATSASYALTASYALNGGSGGVVPAVVKKISIAQDYVNTTTTILTASYAETGPVLYQRYDPFCPPLNSSSLNDEFITDASGTAAPPGFTSVGTLIPSWSIKYSNLDMIVPLNNSAQQAAIEKTLPSGPFTVVIHTSTLATSTFNQAGIYVRSSVSGRMMDMAIARSAGTATILPSLAIEKFTDLSTRNSYVDGGAFYYPFAFLRICYDETNIYTEWSADGIHWVNRGYNEAVGTWFTGGNLPDRFGIKLQSFSSSGNARAAFDFIRYFPSASADIGRNINVIGY